MTHEAGITADSLPGIYREAYLNAVEAARHEHDPGDDWDGFREYLWRALVPAFGLDDVGSSVGSTQVAHHQISP